MEKIILTGDRPTGKLHLGHYVGSIKKRLEMQASNDYDKMYEKTKKLWSVENLCLPLQKTDVASTIQLLII